ncbi:hypothetical protein JR316_0009087 [Psilocybe cubensis]|uniref:Uncharacterized protein n=2 Tax=Psilocybe cubensis TaxID=181762 RepID=A0ACB8GSC7_PSICU|nr:hypothetical protein JR316_0009087 [Psilocybe cubensis]KAH9478630.1 hypothetical protein JR316_0009087 [Psilocybe cubensis]
MAEQAERAFARTFLNTLATQPVAYADDYQQPPQQSLKRVPVLPIPVPPPPARKQRVEDTASSSASLSVTFKSLKPPFAVTLPVHPTDTISAVKLLIAAQPHAPPADAQRLLLKGKALADNKLLKEYTIKDGDTVNLVCKPGVNWDPTAPTPTPAPPATTEKDTTMTDTPNSKPFSFGSGSLSTPAKSSSSGGHRRIPSVVLSPSPSEGTPAQERSQKDIVLTLDMDAGVIPTSPGSKTKEIMSTFHDTVSDPGFWERLYAFLQSEFKTEADVHLAFEDFLCAAKGSLTPFEIAKIRDTVGIVGMAGT